MKLLCVEYNEAGEVAYNVKIGRASCRERV